MGFVNINTNFTIESPDNFWVMNPQLTVFPPYSELYNQDKSKNHSQSSRAMWVINFILNPDEKENIFYRVPIIQRKEMLSATLAPNLNWEDETFKICMESFPRDCMTSLKRNLATAAKSIDKTTKLIDETPLTLNESLIRIDDRGKEYVLNIKGTADQVSKLQKEYNAILIAFDKLFEKYVSEKSEIKAKGGGRISKGEDKNFW